MIFEKQVTVAVIEAAGTILVLRVSTGHQGLRLRLSEMAMLPTLSG
jgi:hypothetical protein